MEFACLLASEIRNIKVVFEYLSLKLRNNKKQIEKDIKSIFTKITTLKEKKLPDDKNQEIIEVCKSRMEELKSKYSQFYTEEQKLTEILHSRIKSLATLEDSSDKSLFDEFVRDKLRSLILETMMRDKLIDSADSFTKLENVKEIVETEIFQEIQSISKSILNKNIQPALTWCNTNKSKLQKLGNNIRFKLLAQEFIEIVSNRSKIEAVKYAKLNFDTLENYKELESLMLLLTIPKEDFSVLPEVAVT